MKDNIKLFKVIFWVITSFVVLFIGTIGTLFALNAREFSQDDKVALIIITVIFSIILILVILMAVFVHKDAKKLHLNPWMWTLIVVYGPNGLGLIIYLIIRSNEKKKLRCIKCGVPVDRDFKICPHCGQQFGKTCSSCGKFIQEEWSVCPYCEEKLT